MPDDDQHVSPTFMPMQDPSSLTTQQLLREIDHLRSLLMADISRVKTETDARFLAMDDATKLRNEKIRDLLPHLRQQIEHLQELDEEKFASLFRMFDERDVRADQLQRAADDALKAALAAAKELVTVQAEASKLMADKVENSTTKQIDQLNIQIAGIQKAFDARLVELKERIDRGEGGKEGTAEAKTDQKTNTSQMVAIGVAILLFVSVLVGIIVALRG